jgi:hypothetical protein
MKNSPPVASRDFGDKETNNNNEERVSHEAEMPPKKRLYNPVTGHYYAVRQRTTDDGQRGQIRGSWSPLKRKNRR